MHSGPTVRPRRAWSGDALLDALAGRSFRTASALAQLHDELLFLVAFPDSPSTCDAARRLLVGFGRRVRALGPRARRRLDGSGLEGTTSRLVYAYGAAEWLVASGERADIDWSAYDAPERLQGIIRLATSPVENDAFDAGTLEAREWLALASRATGRPPLSLLTTRRGESAAARRHRRTLYDEAEVPLAWVVGARHSTSANAVPSTPVVVRARLRPWPARPRALVASPLRDIALLPPALAERWIDASRAALAARGREVFPTTYANPAEVWRADLGEGTCLCVLGVEPEGRLALEANYGYVIFANGIPVGYGGVTPLAAQANTGVNVFDAFRGGEAAMLFAQALRAFRTLFGVTRIIVNPYQFGAGNDEALASGAFWFYDRLGFRPVDPSVRATAAAERRRLQRRAGARSSLATLRRLAASDLVLELPGAAATALFEERWLRTAAIAVAAGGGAAVDAGRLASAIGTSRRMLAQPQYRIGLARLGPALSLIAEQVAGWRGADRRALLPLLRAKGAPQERGFALLSGAHTRLWRTLGRHLDRVDRVAAHR